VYPAEQVFENQLATSGGWAWDSLPVKQLRLLTLKCAWLMDEQGNPGTHREIQAIKIAVPRTVQHVLDGDNTTLDDLGVATVARNQRR